MEKYKFLEAYKRLELNGLMGQCAQLFALQAQGTELCTTQPNEQDPVFSRLLEEYEDLFAEPT